MNGKLTNKIENINLQNLEMQRTLTNINKNKTFPSTSELNF